MKSRRLALSTAVAVALTTFASSAARAAEAQTLQIDGRSRRYVVHDFSTGPKAPLVLLLHGGGGHAENMVEMTQFDTVARQRGDLGVLL